MIISKRHAPRLFLCALVMLCAVSGVPRQALSYDKCDDRIDSQAGEKPTIDGTPYLVVSLGIAQKYCGATPEITSSSLLSMFDKGECGPGTELYNVRKRLALLLDADLGAMLVGIDYYGAPPEELEKVQPMSQADIDRWVKSMAAGADPCPIFLPWHKETVELMNAGTNILKPE